MIQRSYLQLIKSRMEEPRRFIQVLYGPRQVGKTTLVKQLLAALNPPHLFVTADDVVGADSAWLREVWSRARQMSRQLTQQDSQQEAVPAMSRQAERDFLLIIDEVQKIENWSETVKKEWDRDTFEDRPIKVILLGSSSLLLQKGLTESLAGRFESIWIPHWSFAEMQEAFGWTLEQFVWFGGYPGSASLVTDEARWKRYVKESLIETSLSKDILMLTRVDKPALLRRLFEIGCTYSAQILSLTKVQGELQEKGNITTLGNYLSLLSMAGLLHGLEKYAGDIVRKRASKPKFQVFNNALLSAQSEYSFADARSDRKTWGRLCESAVGMHLLNRSYSEDYQLYYWNENSLEVDYVLQKGSKVVAIEVKSGKDSRNEGMALFDARFHPTALYTVGTDGIPMDEFLRLNPADLF